MNKSEFITLIDNPQNLDKSHITALKNIANDFPYFQANHILLTKALFNENHYEYEKQLRTTALLVSNRELLYHFLHDLKIDEAIEEEPVVSEQPSIEVEEITETIEQEVIPEIIVEEVVIESVNETITTTETPVEEVSEIIIEEEPIQEIEKPELVSNKNETHSFAEWLMLSNGKPLPTIAAEITPEKTTLPEIEPKTEPVIEPVKTTNTPKSNVPQLESILDKFIRENPSISRPKAEFYKPATVAKQSIEEDDDLVTETLANIYYKQGAYKKAIRSYEKLCLIYPHKMSYFAALIQKIKEENKND